MRAIVMPYRGGFRLAVEGDGGVNPANLHLVGGDITKLTEDWCIPTREEAEKLASELQERIDHGGRGRKKMTQAEQRANDAAYRIKKMHDEAQAAHHN